MGYFFRKILKKNVFSGTSSYLCRTEFYFLKPFDSNNQMEIVLSIVAVVLGIVVILYGADFLVDGAVAIAYRYRISTAIVGLTIVAFGTSTPELAVSLTSAIQGQTDIALGNVVGSNIFNILGILGVCALMRPLLVGRASLYPEIPFAVIVTLLLCVLSLDSFFDLGLPDKITRGDGLALLFFFVIFMAYTFAVAKVSDNKAAPNANAPLGEPQPSEEEQKVRTKNAYIAALMVAGGLVMLVLGSKVFLYGATEIAKSFHISEAIIGVTLAAVGTSLPELITSVVSVRKGQIDIAVNNVVGSNIFNILFILGATATINPLNRGEITTIDYLFLLGSAVMLFVFSLIPKKGILTRWAGLIFLLTYLVYMAFLIAQAVGKP